MAASHRRVDLPSGTAQEAPPDEDEELIRARALELLGSQTGAVDDAWKDGRGLDLEAALTLATRAL